MIIPKDPTATIVGVVQQKSAVMAAYRLLWFVMRSNDDSDLWPINSLMLSFQDLGGLPLRLSPSTVPPYSKDISSVSHQQVPLNSNLAVA